MMEDDFRVNEENNQENEVNDIFITLGLDFNCDIHNDYLRVNLDAPIIENEIKSKFIQIKFRDIINFDIFSKCFNNLKSAENICINAKKIDHSFCTSLKEYLKKNKSIKYLHIRSYEISNFNLLKDVFSHYSSLEKVVIEIDKENDFHTMRYPPRLVENSSSDDENLSDDLEEREPERNKRQSTIDLIEKYVNRNNRIREFVKNSREYIQSLKQTRDKKKLLIKLATRYDDIGNLCKNRFLEKEDLFHMITQDKNLIENLREAEDWHPLAASRKADFDKLKRIFSANNDFDINKLYLDNSWPGEDEKFVRLVDVTTDENIIKYLVNEKNANITSIGSDETALRIMETHNILLKEHAGLIKRGLSKSLNSFTDMVYDALAFTIAKRERAVFKTILTQDAAKLSIDLNLPIKQGIYKDYTLLQLVCIHFNDISIGDTLSPIYDQLRRLSTQERKNLLRSRFPNNSKYIYFKDVTVLEYLTYHLHLKFLFLIFNNDIKFDQNDNLTIRAQEEKSYYHYLSEYNLLQLFIQGILDKLGGDFDDIKQYYLILTNEENIKHWGNIKNLCLRRPDISLSSNIQIEIPIFYYVVMFSRSEFAIKFSINLLFNSLFSLDKRIDIYQYKNLTSFHASLMFGNDSWEGNSIFCQLFLNKILSSKKANRETIINLLSEKVFGNGEYNNYTLFQIAVLNCLWSFIKACISKNIDMTHLINMPYPKDSQYAGWTPIQIALHFVKIGKNSADQLLDILSNIKGVDLGVCYPKNTYMMGLSIFQAMVLKDPDPALAFSGFPGKYFSADSIKQFLKKIDASQVNYICQDRNSKFYGMTTLHIALYNKDASIVQALLESEKTDYTIADFYKKTPLEIIKDSRNENLNAYIAEAIKKYPHHSTKYFDCLAYKSEVCPSLIITYDKCIVSLAKENNSEHAFLIFEGLVKENEGAIKASIWAAHVYVPKSSNNLLFFISTKGRIEIKDANEEITIGKGKTGSLLQKVRKKLNSLISLKEGTMLFYVSSYTDKESCRKLIEQIQKQEEIEYTLPGRLGFSGSGGVKGDNCVGWAVEKYNQAVPEERKLSPDWSSYIFTNARGFLTKEFIYVADATESRDLLREEVSRLSYDKQRLFARYNTSLNRQNIQSGLLSFLVTFLFADIKWPDSSHFNLTCSALAGLLTFYALSSKWLSPEEREYNEKPRNEYQYS